MRAEGLEPPRAFAHRLLRPACFPDFTTPARRSEAGLYGWRTHPDPSAAGPIMRTDVRPAKHVRPSSELETALGLVAAGLNDCEIARQTGIPRCTIRDWRHGRSQQLSRGGCEHDFTSLPASHYAYLLGVYLGDGCLSAQPRTWVLRIFMDAKYPLIVRECSEAMEAVLPGKVAHQQAHHAPTCVVISMYSKHWPCLLPQHGPGRKHLRPIELVEWQRALVSESHEWLLRGLIHSDGCRIIARERKGGRIREAPRYVFSNLSEDIKRIFCDSCDALGVRWTRPNAKSVAIYRGPSVARLDEFIGPKR